MSDIIVGEAPARQGRDLVADGAEAMEVRRQERETQAHTVQLAGKPFEVRPVFDLRALVAAQRGNVGRALELMLVNGGDDVDRLLEGDQVLTGPEVEHAIGKWAEVTGSSTGESSASSSS